MTRVVKSDILTGLEEIDNLHFYMKITNHCAFIEKLCIFSKFVVNCVQKYNILSNKILMEYLILKSRVEQGR